MPLLIQTLGPGGNGPNVVSRPFVLGLLLLLLFLSTQTDWSPAARRQRMEIRAGLASGSLQKQEIMREKVRRSCFSLPLLSSGPLFFVSFALHRQW